MNEPDGGGAGDEFDGYLTRIGNLAQDMKSLGPQIDEAVDIMWRSLVAGGTIFWCGNGGSAAEAQHLAAELVGRFALERPPIRSLAITTDSSVITALGNDYGYDTVFARQVAAFCAPTDTLVALTTSGESPNVLAALAAAGMEGAATIAFVGSRQSSGAAIADCAIQVPSAVTSHIQEGHLIVGHFLCLMLERMWAQKFEAR